MGKNSTIESLPLMEDVEELPSKHTTTRKQPWQILLEVVLGGIFGCILTGILSSIVYENHRPLLAHAGFPVASEINSLVPEYMFSAAFHLKEANNAHMALVPLRKTKFTNLTVSWPSADAWLAGTVSELEWSELHHHLHSLIPRKRPTRPSMLLLATNLACARRRRLSDGRLTRAAPFTSTCTGHLLAREAHSLQHICVLSVTLSCKSRLLHRLVLYPKFTNMAHVGVADGDS